METAKHVLGNHFKLEETLLKTKTKTTKYVVDNNFGTGGNALSKTNTKNMSLAIIWNRRKSKHPKGRYVGMSLNTKIFSLNLSTLFGPDVHKGRRGLLMI